MLLSLFILVSLMAIGALVWFRLRDTKYLQKPTREVLGESLREEIEKEKEGFARAQEKFGQALERASQKIK